MAVKKNAKKDKELSLEDVLWNCRVALRGIGSTEKNRDAVIGLVFLKFSGDKFEKRHAQLKEEYPNLPDKVMEKPSFYNSDNVFSIGVPVNANRCFACTAFTAFAPSEVGFLINCASSIKHASKICAL